MKIFVVKSEASVNCCNKYIFAWKLLELSSTGCTEKINVNISITWTSAVKKGDKHFEKIYL